MFAYFDTASGSWVIGTGWCVNATGEEAGRSPDKWGVTEDDCFKLCLADTSLNGCASFDNDRCATYTGDIKGSNGNGYYKCFYRDGIDLISFPFNNLYSSNNLIFVKNCEVI